MNLSLSSNVHERSTVNLFILCHLFRSWSQGILGGITFYQPRTQTERIQGRNKWPYTWKQKSTYLSNCSFVFRVIGRICNFLIFNNWEVLVLEARSRPWWVFLPRNLPISPHTDRAIAQKTFSPLCLDVAYKPKQS